MRPYTQTPTYPHTHTPKARLKNLRPILANINKRVALLKERKVIGVRVIGVIGVRALRRPDLGSDAIATKHYCPHLYRPSINPNRPGLGP